MASRRTGETIRTQLMQETPQSTVEALMYQAREGGPAALFGFAAQERLDRCDPAARKQIEGRLAKIWGERSAGSVMRSATTGRDVAVQIEGGADCPKCGVAMQRYEHSAGWMPRSGRNWYRYWDRCGPCFHIQHYEAAKVRAA